jgi:hypothetical protein
MTFVTIGLIAASSISAVDLSDQEIDGKQFAENVQKIFQESIAIWTNPGGNPYTTEVFKAKGEMPPATGFWSVTLYDSENGFFIPNDRKK